MLSTLVSYRMNATDYAKSLERIAQQPAVAREAKYYEEKIGGVKTVDDLVSDYRLLSYSLKAYGLDDYVSKPGFIRKVLESDLTDNSSFANKLSDTRFRQFAANFNFKSADLKVQSTAQAAVLSEAYSEHRVALSTKAAATAKAYSDAMARVANVDDFVQNRTLVEVTLKAAGIDPTNISTDYLAKVLTGQIVDDPSTASDNAVMALKARFNFDADGNLATSGTPAVALPAMSADTVDQVLHDYDVAIGNTAGSGFAARETAYVDKLFTAAANGSVTIDAMLDDKRFLDYVYDATGLTDVSEPKSFLADILKNPSKLAALPDDTAAQKQRKDRLSLVASWVKLDASGEVAARSTEDKAAFENAYFANYAITETERDARLANRYSAVMANVSTLSQFLTNDTAFGDDHLEYALAAFGIDVAEVSRTELRKILTSDISDPKSYVNKLGDERFVKFAAVYNFGADGKLAEQRSVQSVNQRTQTGTLYKASFGTDLTEAQEERIKTVTEDYLTRVGKMTNLDQFLADKTVLNYTLKAYGLDEKNLAARDIRKILTSDLSDPASFVYSYDDADVVKFAKAFNFTPAGLIAAPGAGGIQSGASRVEMKNLYLSSQLELDVGQQSEGARLALYFNRKAADLTSVYGILADKPLLEVVKTALSLPDGFSNLEIERQAKILEEKIDLEDFKDETKLDTFVNRFAALYDMKNGTGQSTSPVLQLFGGASSNGDILSLLY